MHGFNLDRNPAADLVALSQFNKSGDAYLSLPELQALWRILGCYPGRPAQRCQVYFMRNLLSCVPKASQSLVGTLVRQVFVHPDAASAQMALTQNVAFMPGEPFFPAGILRYPSVRLNLSHATPAQMEQEIAVLGELLGEFAAGVPTRYSQASVSVWIISSPK